MKPFAHSTANQSRLLVMGVEHIIRLDGAQTGGDFALIEVNSPGGGPGIPLHTHSRDDETFYIIEGQIEYAIGELRGVARAGETLIAPRGVPHTFKSGEEGARILVILRPAGAEQMFQELAALPAGPPKMKRVVEICGRYGVQFHAGG